MIRAPKVWNGGNHSGHELAPGSNLEITGQGAKAAATELSQQPAVVFEEDAQHPGDGENDLAVGDIEEKRLPHPLAPLLEPLRMARGTEAAGAAGEHQEAFRVAVRTADAGKAAARVAAVEVALHDFLDNRPEEAVLLLKTALVFRQKPIEVMKEHPIQDGALGMSRAIESGHIERMASRNGPAPRI